MSEIYMYSEGTTISENNIVRIFSTHKVAFNDENKYMIGVMFFIVRHQFKTWRTKMLSLRTDFFRIV